MPIRSPSKPNDPKPPAASPLPKPEFLLNLLGHAPQPNHDRHNRIRPGPIPDPASKRSPAKLPRQPDRARLLKPIRKCHQQLSSPAVQPCHFKAKPAQHRPKPSQGEPSLNNREQ